MKESMKITFDELSEKAKERACQQIGDAMTDDEWWYEPIFDMFVGRCREYGMEVDVDDIHFTGFYSQGDGASFTCNNIDTKKLLNSLEIQISDELEEKASDYIKVSISRTTNRACHEQTVKVDVDVDALVEEEDEETIQDIQDVADTLEFKLEALKDNLCQKLYYDLELEYDYLHSAEYVDEIAYDNGMLFLEDGAIYSWGE